MKKGAGNEQPVVQMLIQYYDCMEHFLNWISPEEGLTITLVFPLMT